MITNNAFVFSSDENHVTRTTGFENHWAFRPRYLTQVQHPFSTNMCSALFFRVCVWWIVVSCRVEWMSQLEQGLLGRILLFSPIYRLCNVHCGRFGVLSKASLLLSTVSLSHYKRELDRPSFHHPYYHHNGSSTLGNFKTHWRDCTTPFNAL